MYKKKKKNPKILYRQKRVMTQCKACGEPSHTDKDSVLNLTSFCFKSFSYTNLVLHKKFRLCFLTSWFTNFSKVAIWFWSLFNTCCSHDGYFVEKIRHCSLNEFISSSILLCFMTFLAIYLQQGTRIDELIYKPKLCFSIK